MLKANEIDRIAAEVASNDLPAGSVVRVTSEEARGTDGEDMLRVLYVIRTDFAEAITGQQTLDALLDLQDELRAAGEQRFASIEYATEAELAHGGS